MTSRHNHRARGSTSLEFLTGLALLLSALSLVFAALWLQLFELHLQLMAQEATQILNLGAVGEPSKEFQQRANEIKAQIKKKLRSFPGAQLFLGHLPESRVIIDSTRSGFTRTRIYFCTSTPAPFSAQQPQTQKSRDCLGQFTGESGQESARRPSASPLLYVEALAAQTHSEKIFSRGLQNIPRVESRALLVALQHQEDR